MTRYNNRSGDSGVIEYEIGPDFIIVTFESGSSYLYNYHRPGKANVDQMKSMAVRGEGLNSFINKNVKDRYARKLR